MDYSLGVLTEIEAIVCGPFTQDWNMLYMKLKFVSVAPLKISFCLILLLVLPTSVLINLLLSTVLMP